MTERPLSPEIETWCRGCRLVGRRPLTEAERTWALRLRKRHGVRAVLGAVALPAALFVGLNPVLSRADSGAGDSSLFWSYAILLIAVPVSILFVRDHWQAARRLAQDLGAGGALLFEPPEDVAPALAWSDETSGEERPAPTVMPFGLLEHSRRVVDLEDIAPHVVSEDVVEVDSHAGAGLYAPLYLSVEGPTDGLRLHQRALSSPERHELEGLNRRLGAPRLSTLLAAAVLVWLFSMAATVRTPVRRSPLEFGDVFSAIVGILVCARVLVRDARSIVLASRIRHDLMVGLVVRADSESGGGSEFLPVSRLVWRRGGAPAGWRDRGRGADRLRQGL